MWYDATSAAGSLEASDSPGQGQVRVCAGAGRQDQVVRVALHVGLGGRRRRAPRRTRRGSSSPGRRARRTKSSSAPSSGGPSVPAGKRASTYSQRRLRQERRSLCDPDHEVSHRVRGPREPGRPAPSGPWYPVRRHPGVPGPRHEGEPVRQLGYRGSGQRSTRPWTRVRPWPRRSPRSTRSDLTPCPPRPRARPPASSAPVRVPRARGQASRAGALQRSGDWARRAPLLPALDPRRHRHPAAVPRRRS